MRRTPATTRRAESRRDPVETPTEPHETEPPHVVDTHISTLFFAGDRVYKLKKPVRFGFVDFSTIPNGPRERTVS